MGFFCSQKPPCITVRTSEGSERLSMHGCTLHLEPLHELVLSRGGIARRQSTQEVTRGLNPNNIEDLPGGARDLFAGERVAGGLNTIQSLSAPAGLVTWPAFFVPPTAGASAVSRPSRGAIGRRTGRRSHSHRRVCSPGVNLSSRLSLRLCPIDGERFFSSPIHSLPLQAGGTALSRRPSFSLSRRRRSFSTRNLMHRRRRFVSIANRKSQIENAGQSSNPRCVAPSLNVQRTSGGHP